MANNILLEKQICVYGKNEIQTQQRITRIDEPLDDWFIGEIIDTYHIPFDDIKRFLDDQETDKGDTTIMLEKVLEKWYSCLNIHEKAQIHDTYYKR